MSCVVIKNVCKSFGNLQILKGISLEIEKGESHIILGRSGCGKSVLLKCLLGILKIDSGDIFVNGLSVNDKKNSNDYIGKFSVLFQGNALFDSMSIIENVEFGVSQINKNKKECREIAREKLFAVGLDERVFELYPAETSGGMQKRVALARAIAVNPDVLLFDEPTSGLDPMTGGVVCNLLRNTVQSLGLTAITITHDIKVAAFLADKVSVLNDGVVVWGGQADDMKVCGNEFVENFYKASNIITNLKSSIA